MIEAEKSELVRRKDGSYTHFEWWKLLNSLGDAEVIPDYVMLLFEMAHRCKLQAVSFECTVDEGSPAYEEYVERGNGFSRWELAPPSADAVLLSIHDTEDGPFQLWAVPSAPFDYDLVAHLDRQRAFSVKAFGPGARAEGISDHIRKELAEVAAAPEDLSEWIDIVLLGFDGAWRAGHSSVAIAGALAGKLAKNERRDWPDWRTADPNKAIEHNREVPANA